MAWSLYKKDKFLEPLLFSNGKTQEDVMQEVLDLINQNNKIIFIKGICGTGKSAIALNIAKELGKTSIVVPGKNLQAQYERDYAKELYLLKNDKKLKISIITGRNNHKCKLLEESQDNIPKIKREVNSKLHDIFSGIKKEKIEKDISSDNYNLPCKIEIKERNWNKIKEYLKQNKDVNLNNFSDIKDVKRVSIAASCPYWSPAIPEKYELGGRSFANSIKKKYTGLKKTDFVFYQRRLGCSFYSQFNSYIDSDVIVFNSLKYKLESALNRKPLTEAEIIDECDEFLDSFSNQRSINIDRLQNSLIYFLGDDSETVNIVKEIQLILKQIRHDKRIKESIEKGEIIPLKKTGIYDLIKIFLNNKGFADEFDDESYIFEVDETARSFEDFLDETYLTASKKDDSLFVNLVTTNLSKKFSNMVKDNKRIVLMSGTIHSKEVLKNIFGIENFKIIEAETESQGRIDIVKTGKEKDCKYSNFHNGKVNRESYLRALSKCIEIAKKPALVHVNAFMDLPNEEELKEFDIDNLISREKLKELQNKDKKGILIDRFKRGQTNILFSTRSGRGIDFPGEQCNSIIFTKYPNPNVQDLFWKVLHETKPLYYWAFYKDKAKRELWQKVYRGIRSKDDHIYVLSPDSRVLKEFENSAQR